MGFEEAEAEQYLEVQQKLPDLPLFLQQNPLRLTVAEPLKLEGLTEIERQSIVVKSEAPGRIEIEVHGQRFETIRQAKDETIAWLLWYNQTRMHSTLHYASPMQFEKDWMQAKVKIAA